MSDQQSAYIVSSLKYRPQTFDDVIGQEHITRTLRNAVIRERLANGYLFTGPRGVGKTTTARILAKSLNCEQPVDGNPCNSCNHCGEITGGRNLDVLEVDGASTRGIDAIRELREVVKYPPTSSRYRIYIIDEVHMLTKEAFNALLKTLEEPPPQVLFIFATTEPQKVPLTILSRCQRYDFRRIAVDQMSTHLEQISVAEGYQVQKDALRLLARKGGGSLRDALSLLDQVTALADKDITIELVRDVLGILDNEIYFTLLDLILARDDAQLLAYLKELLERGIAISEFLQGFSDHLRNLLINLVSGDASLLELSETEISSLQQQTEKLNERDLIRYQNMLQQAQRDLRTTSNQSVALELLLLKMSHLTSAVTLDSLMSGKQAVVPPQEKVSGAESREQTALKIPPPPLPESTEPAAQKQAAPVQEPEPAPPAASPPPEPDPEPEPAPGAGPEQGTQLDLDGIKSGWEAFLQVLNKESHSLRSFMSEGEPVGYADRKLEVHFSAEHAYHIERLEKDRHRIEEVLEKHYGDRIRIKYIKNNEKKPKKREDDEILGHPTSQHVLNIFNGEIIDK